MQFAELVAVSDAVATTRSRKQKVERFADCLRRLAPDEVEAGVGYLAGALPQGRIGIGYAALRDVRVAPSAEPSLSVGDVHRAIDALAAVSGAGSGAARARQLGALLARATAAEQDFFARLVLGNLRQGASEGIVVDAVARAAGVPLAEVRRAFMVSGQLGAVARAALIEGGGALDQFAVQLFRPLLPMLAQPAEDFDAVFGRMDEAAFEYKLDGARIQLHKDGDDVRVFSRRLNDVTDAVPEIVEAARALPARELVLDGEAIALRPDGAPQPFQVTMRRFGRRLDVEAMRRELPLSALYFDALRIEGDSLLDRPTRERIEALAVGVPDAQRVPRLITGDVAAAEAFWREALDRGHEGLMAKALDADYAAGGRGHAWLKLKPAHTLDLVILAAEWGSGRRRGWLSNVHLGARDPAAGGFVMLGKTFKGMTDEMLRWQTDELLSLELSRDEYTVYVKPALVAEVAFNDVQVSPQYPGGMALRFARVKRYRDDKGAEDADTVDAVRALLAQSEG